MNYFEEIKKAKELGNERLAWDLMCQAESAKSIEVRNANDADEMEAIQDRYRKLFKEIGYE